MLFLGIFLAGFNCEYLSQRKHSKFNSRGPKFTNNLKNFAQNCIHNGIRSDHRAARVIFYMFHTTGNDLVNQLMAAVFPTTTGGWK